MPKKLLLVTQKVDVNDSNLGFFVNWINEFSKQFTEVVVICLSSKKSPLAKNVRVVPLGKDRDASKISMVSKFYKTVFKEISSTDVFFVHMTPIWVVLAGIFFRMKRKPVALWYVHGSVPLVIRCAEKICTTIFSTAPESFRLKSKKVNFVGHGIDLDLFKFVKRKPKKSCKILSISRISKAKNIELMIDSFSLFNKNNPRAKLVIIGTPITPKGGEYFTKVKKKVNEYNLSTSVTFAGSIPHKLIKNKLADSDIFLNFSDTGSTDKAVLEAMATGLPVITSNVSYRKVPNIIFVKKDASTIAKKMDSMCRLSVTKRAQIAKSMRTYAEKNSIKNLIGTISKKLKLFYH